MIVPLEYHPLQISSKLQVDVLLLCSWRPEGGYRLPRSTRIYSTSTILWKQPTARVHSELQQYIVSDVSLIQTAKVLLRSPPLEELGRRLQPTEQQFLRDNDDQHIMRKIKPFRTSTVTIMLNFRIAFQNLTFSWSGIIDYRHYLKPHQLPPCPAGTLEGIVEAYGMCLQRNVLKAAEIPSWEVGPIPKSLPSSSSTMYKPEAPDISMPNKGSLDITIMHP